MIKVLWFLSIVLLITAVDSRVAWTEIEADAPNKTTETNERAARNQLQQGYVYYRQGEMENALKCWSRAIALDPSYKQRGLPLLMSSVERSLRQQRSESSSTHELQQSPIQFGSIGLSDKNTVPTKRLTTSGRSPIFVGFLGLVALVLLVILLVRIYGLPTKTVWRTTPSMILDLALIVFASSLFLFAILCILALPLILIFGGMNDYPGSVKTELLKASGMILGSGFTGTLLVFILNQRRAAREHA